MAEDKVESVGIGPTNDAPDPAPVPVDQPPAGTHMVEYDGDTVRIKDVELFVGFIPGFDADDDRDMKGWTPDAIDESVKETKKWMGAGSFPQIVVRHEDPDGEPTPSESVGSVVDVKARTFNVGESTGPGIVGTIECSRGDFRHWYEKGRYPRRSAEIHPKTKRLAQVALLGRDAPKRPLPDMKFSEPLAAIHALIGRMIGRGGESVEVYDQELPILQFDMAAAGPQNVAVPHVVRKKEPTQMADDDKDKKPDGGLSLQKLSDEVKSIAETVKELVSSMKKHSDDEEPDKNEDEKKPDTNGADEDGDGKDTTKPKTNKHGDPHTMDTFSEMLKLRCEMKVNTLRTEGYRITPDAEKMIVGELMACSDDAMRDEKVLGYRQLIARDPVNGHRQFSADGVVPVGAEAPGALEQLDKPSANSLVFSLRDKALRKAEATNGDPALIFKDLMDETVEKHAATG